MAITDIYGPVPVPALDEFAQPGIYFLHRSGAIVYVGQAVNMRRRIADHVGEAAKRFDAVSCIPCPHHRLNELERMYISRLLPEYNQCRLSKLLRTGEPTGAQPRLDQIGKSRRFKPRPASRSSP